MDILEARQIQALRDWSQMPERLLTVKEAAERLNQTENGLRWLLHQGTAPKSARLGGRRMFRESDIEAWINAAFDREEAS